MSMDAENPLWDYLNDPAALEALIADGESVRVSVEILTGAVATGNVALVRILLNAGGAALLDAFDADLGWTALMWAASRGDAAMTTCLIDAGSDVNAHDESRIGDTALMVAVEHGLLDIARILIDHGADPMIAGWMGRTPLDSARERKRMPELFALLSQASIRRDRRG
jgi:ankyrin repeat protein